MDEKLYKVSQEISNIIYLFFDGEVNKLNKKEIKELSEDPENYDKLNLETMKELNKIIKLRDDKEKDFRIILKEPKIETESEEEQEQGEEIEEIQESLEDKPEVKKYILSQRKAYVKWINEVFYPEIIDEKKQDELLKIYQRFVKKYLSINTPYRGLLVYHGLGTGKTATAISTAEGLSNTIPITTLLPASLETEFIKEIKRWGDEFFDIKSNNWIFYDIKNIQSDLKLRELIKKKYKITLDNIKSISIKSRNLTKDKSLKTGFWIETNDIENYGDIIKTYPTIKSGQTYNSSVSYIKKNQKDTKNKSIKLTENEFVFINEQISFIIKLKYNFIHYNPLPPINVKKKEKYTNVDKISIKLNKELKKNLKNNINSPFDDEVIIIDEVHNFVREIYNNSGPSRQYYDWIMNSENVKLVFLSGTPIINRPSEVAILSNMLKGNINTYTFVINDTIDTKTIDDKLKELFYNDNSPVEQFFYRKKSGKLLITFIKNKTNYESLLDDTDDIVYTIKYKEQTFDQFIGFIYTRLAKLFDKNIIPKLSDIKKDKKKILSGSSIIYDKDTQTRFNINQKLFEIYKNDGTVIDLTNNENFMEYFFNDDELTINPSKRILLKRMLMGLISYYPIDRSSIKNMPTITKPNNLVYNDYNISKKIKVEICPFSSKQFIKYEEVWKEAKLKSIKQAMFAGDEESETFDYHIRTRQACNVVYENDDFRKIKKTDDNKLVIEKMKQDEYRLLLEADILKIDNGLNMISPKFYKIMKNIQKYLDQDKTPTGKILYYSEFRSDAGSEIFEQILIANGYVKYNGEQNPSSQKRYTFISGKEPEDERKRNKEAFNDINNLYGDKIQIMIISGAGAEGISLTSVRQVHIMEPYWNFVRIDQVFGRAIRLGSHKELPEKERTVEQFLYLSTFPDGNTIKDIYYELKTLGTWQVPELEESEDIVNLLFTNHKELYTNIQKIIKLKTDTRQKTADDLLFQKMEKKYNISQEIIKVIQESSVDCIQNTRDNIVLNDNCIRYDDKLITEQAFFPGMDDKQLQLIDKKQLDAEFMHFIKPDIYVVLSTIDTDDYYAYYKIDKKSDIDIRYIKDNGILLGLLNIYNSLYYSYEISDNKFLNENLGNKFSIYQTIYLINDTQLLNISNSNIFPNITDIKELIGFKIKHNSSELFFYKKNDDKKIIRLYEYDISEKANFDIKYITPIIVSDNIIYKIDN